MEIQDNKQELQEKFKKILLGRKASIHEILHCYHKGLCLVLHSHLQGRVGPLAEKHTNLNGLGPGK